MILSTVLATLFLTSAVEWPDPYVGWSFQAYPNKHAIGLNSAGTQVIRKNRRKFIDLGLPLGLRTFTPEGLAPIKMVFTPELHIGNELLLSNFLIGMEQDLPMGSYRSVPESLFWGLTGGLHLGFLHDPQDLTNSSGSKLNSVDRISIATAIKFYFGPSFGLNQNLSLRLRFFADVMVGKVGAYQTRTGFSNNVGSVTGIQLQLAFK